MSIDIKARKREWNRKAAKVWFDKLTDEQKKEKSDYTIFRDKHRTAIMNRDNNECQLCGSKTKLQPHHILPKKEYPELICDINNIITLCKDCHINKAHPKGYLKEYDSKIAEQLMAKIEAKIEAKIND